MNTPILWLKKTLRKIWFCRSYPPRANILRRFQKEAFEHPSLSKQIIYREQLKKSKVNRCFTLEALECRAMLIAEGTAFGVDQTVSTAGLLGTVSAVAQWGDGLQTNLNVASSATPGTLKVRFDYSLDTTGFFNVPERRTALQASADIVFSKYSDTLTAITPTATNTWQAVFPNPTTGATQIISGSQIAANELVIYVGARDLAGNAVARAGPGGFGWNGTPAWGQLVTTRGQAGASGATQTDIGPWGGSMTIDPTIKWHFGTSTAGLDSDEYDFISVVSHEFMHILGFGIIRPDVVSSWSRLVSNGFFTGSNARAANGGQNVRLSSETEHWAEGTQSNGQEALMDPSLNNLGIRKLPTALDVAGLQDIGWQLIPQQARVTGSKVYGDDGSYPVSITVAGSTAGQLTVNLGNVSVTNVAPTITNTVTPKSVRVNVPLSIADIGIFSDPGFGSSETFRYEINWGDNLPNNGSLSSGNATIDRAGGASVPTLGSFDGTHTYSTTGNYTVTYKVTDDNGGVAQKTFTVQVLSPPEIRLSLGATQIAESAGAAATTLTIDLVGFDNSVPVAVNLTSSDTSEATLLGNVIFPAGTTRVTTPINAVDDSLLDGLQSVTFNAVSGLINASPVRLNVTDIETIGLGLAVASVREDAGVGATVLRVTRSNTDTQAALTVALVSNSAIATLPATVVIPANAAFVDVGVNVIDDSILNGVRNVLLRGSATGYVSSEVPLTINDYEPVQWVSSSFTLTEGSTTSARTVEVSIPAPAPAGGLTLTITSSAPGRLTLPATAFIAAGQSRASVPISLANNSLSENNVDVAVTASATGYAPSILTIRAQDDDRSVWTNPSDIYDVNADRGVTVLDVLNVINYINAQGVGQLPVPRPASEIYSVDVSGDGFITPLDVLLVINFLNQRAAT